MKKTVLIFALITLFFGGINAQGRHGLIRHARPPSGYGQGSSFSFSNLFGYGTLNGDFPGSIYITMSLGPSFLHGDINGTLSNTISLGGNNMGSVGLLHILEGNYGYKLSYMYGSYIGSDVGSPTLDHFRGYGYSTKLSEISLEGRYYVFGGPYSPGQTAHSIYGFGGFGLLLSNSRSTGSTPTPLAIYQQKATTLDIPFGFGYQYELNDNILIGTEFGEHYALADHVDGFKPLVGNKATDVLTHFALTLTFKLYKGKKF